LTKLNPDAQVAITVAEVHVATELVGVVGALYPPQNVQVVLSEFKK